MHNKNSGIIHTLSIPLIIITTFIVLFCQEGCKTITIANKYKTKNTYNGTVKPSLESRYKIDIGKTYEMYFKLNKKEKCLKFDVKTEKISGYIDKKDKYLGTYYVIEKSIDISRFTEKGGQILFSEIGRNFSRDWRRKEEIIICSSKEDPIKKFDTSIFRIRFTAFNNEIYNFFITIYSEHKIQFLEKY